MQKLLFPLKVIAAVFLAIISVILRIIGPFAGFITGVFGIIGFGLSIIIDLGAVICTIAWISGMESFSGSDVLIIWLIAFFFTAICGGGVLLGERTVDLGESTWNLAKKLLGMSAPSYNDVYSNPEYYSSQQEAVNISSDDAEEIFKFKKLLEMGAITQEEFETKKNQILNR